jgi:hypothetical protein
MPLFSNIPTNDWPVVLQSSREIWGILAQVRVRFLGMAPARLPVYGVFAEYAKAVGRSSTSRRLKGVKEMLCLSRRGGSVATATILTLHLFWTCGYATAAVVFSHPPNLAGGLIASSWVDPDGSDVDQYAYDAFILGADRSISEVRFRGGYLYDATLPNGSKDLVTYFRITFYASVIGNFQPVCGNPHMTETVFLADEWVGTNAGETAAGTFGGTEMYDYTFVLATPFQAKRGVKYWIKIEGSQTLYPAWAIAVGTGGENQHFHFDAGAMQFSYRTGDTAFTLIAPGPDPYSIADVSRALTLTAGLDTATADEMARLNVETANGSAAIDCCDAILIARKVAGIEPNP